MRALSLLPLACSLLAAAPARAQSSLPPLREYVGVPIAYRVGVPTRWKLKQDGRELTATNGRIMLIVMAEDLLASKEEIDLPVPPDEQRRILTNMIMGSEPLMLAMMDSLARGVSEKSSHCSELKREMRELGGQSAGFVSLECEVDTVGLARVDAWLTLKDGVLYALMCFAPSRLFPANEPLFEQVRASVVLAAVPPGGTAK